MRNAREGAGLERKAGTRVQGWIFFYVFVCARTSKQVSAYSRERVCVYVCVKFLYMCVCVREMSVFVYVCACMHMYAHAFTFA